MAENHNFRSAFNGFNRQDVVRYIEYVNTKHTNQINQYKSEIQTLSDELATLQVQSAEETVSQEAYDEVVAQRDAALAELETLRQQAAAKPAVMTLAEEELAAYRRAERAEREAKERAQVMYRQATAVLADATAQVDDTAAQLDVISTRVKAQLLELQTAVADSKRSLQEAVSVIAAIRPEDAE